MQLPHITKIDLVLQLVVYPRPVVIQALIIRFRFAIDQSQGFARKYLPLARYSQAFCVAAVAERYRYRIVACLVTSSSPVPLKTRRVGQRCTLNLSRAETSSRWCGVIVRRGVPTQVSSTSLDHGSKLRGPSPKALVQLNRETLISNQSINQLTQAFCALTYDCSENISNSVEMLFCCFH
ncbi:uncharacterized protein TNCV_2976661 [Trichonephila clavipes]|nr:uncharacterized protein TNCV_2976661 [Trichonephila clavipes]